MEPFERMKLIARRSLVGVWIVGGAKEEIAAVLERNLRAVGSRTPTLRAVAFDGHLDARGKVAVAQAASKQRVRCARFNRPIGDLAVGILHVDMKPAVGVDPLH